MDEGLFVLIFRIVAVFIIVTWASGFVRTIGQPSDWKAPLFARVPPTFRTVPVYGRIIAFAERRDGYRIVSLLGVAAGIALFAWTFTESFPV